jgi:hypothetical protein
VYLVRLISVDAVFQRWAIVVAGDGGKKFYGFGGGGP